MSGGGRGRPAGVTLPGRRTPTPPGVITPLMACRILGIGRDSLRAAITRGEIPPPYQPDGGVLRWWPVGEFSAATGIPVADLNEWLAAWATWRDPETRRQQPQPPGPLMICQRALSAYLGVADRTIRRRMRAGRWPQPQLRLGSREFWWIGQFCTGGSAPRPEIEGWAARELAARQDAARERLERRRGARREAAA